MYPGWHSIPERDAAFHAGFTEWELVEGCRPRFPGHHQPRVPLLGAYDDRDPAEVARRLELGLAHGVDAFVYGFFWCRGKRVFQDALDLGFLGSSLGGTTPFALMWANRMPRRVLPVRRSDLPVIAAERRVETDEDDFEAFVGYLCDRYFTRPNYLRVDGAVYLSIFDSTFFLRELGVNGAGRAIERARRVVRHAGVGELHLAAIDPADDVIEAVRAVGFDSVTHYVLLPRWRGPTLQDYSTEEHARAEQRESFSRRSGLPYMPSVSPGWDASPRGADFGPERPDRYPWSPVVVGSSPERFREALSRALTFESPVACPDPLTFVASWNEWSEGHYLEPDVRHRMAWLEALRDARAVVG